MTADEHRETLVHRLLHPVSTGLWRVWSFVRSTIGGLYVLIGVTSFFGYSELSQIRKAVQELTSDTNGSTISQILSAADDPNADSATRASSRAFNLHINGRKDAALAKMHAILAVLEGLPNIEERRSRAWYAIGIFHHQDFGAAGNFIVNRDDLEGNRQAIEAYNNVIELNFDHVAAYVNRGIAHDVLGQYEDAERNYSTAIQLRPDAYRTYFHRGELYLRLSQHNNARIDLEKALSLAQDAEDDAFVTEAQRLLDDSR